MPDFYGNFDPTQPNRFANGARVNAGRREYEKVFNLATDAPAAGGVAAGAANRLHVARIPKGCKFKVITVTTTANLSGLTLAIGTASAPDKYVQAIAGPNNGTLTFHIRPDAIDSEELANQEDVFLTWAGGALPAAGKIGTSLAVTKR